MDKAGVASSFRVVLAWPGIVADQPLPLDAVERWDRTPGLSFVDAYLAAVAARDDCPIDRMSVRELRRQDVRIPVPLFRCQVEARPDALSPRSLGELLQGTRDGW